MVTRFKYLDHGFVKLVDSMGSDKDICDAARVSNNLHNQDKSDDQNKRLINYLMKNRHTSPFEMCVLKLHCKVPIFVARQLMRHRMASINETSGRYIDLSKMDFYTPEFDDIAVQSESNKQGRSDKELPAIVKNEVRQSMQLSCNASKNTYKDLIACNIAKELSRAVLPQSMYTEFFWKIDLHNLLHFIKLRAHPHAQKEIRNFASILVEIVKVWVPFSWEAFENHVLNAKTISKDVLDAIEQANDTNQIKELLGLK